MAKLSRSLYQTSHPRAVSVQFGDISGGLCTVRRGLELADNELDDILNFKYVRTDKVAAQLREGLTRLTTTEAGSPLVDLGFYVDASGDTHTLGVYNSDLATLSDGAWSKVADLAGTRGRMVQFADKMIVADGSYLKQFDGTSLELCYDHGGTMLSSTEGYSSATKLYTGSVTRAGQKFTTPSWDSGYTVPSTKATFWLSKVGNPTGTLVCKVRTVSGDTEVATSATMTADDLQTGGQEETFTLTSSTDLEPSTAYYVVIEYSDAGSSVSHCVQVHYTTDTAASGNYATYNGSWSDVSGDCYLKFYPALPPKASMLAVRYNRLLCDNQSTGQRNWFHESNVNDPNQWSGTGASYLICEQGTEITCIKNYYDVLLIHLGGEGYKSVLKYAGSSLSAGAVSTVMRGVAAINQDVAHNIGNDFVFLSDSGVISLGTWEAYGDLEQAIVSDKVADLVNENVSTSRFAGFCVSEQQYWLEYGESTGKVLVFDNKLKVWTQYRFGLAGFQPTNLLPYSEDFSAPTYVQNNVNLVSSVAVDPDGGNTAHQFSGASATSANNWLRYGDEIGVTPDTQYTLSVHVKNVDATEFRLAAWDVTNNALIGTKDVFGEIGTGSFVRVSYSFTTPSGCGEVYVYPAAYLDSGGDAIVWGAQVELGSSVNDYVQTSGSPASGSSTVLPTCFATWGGDIYIGGEDGHCWKLNNKTPVYYDGDSANEYDARLKFGATNLKTSQQKHFRFITSKVYSKLGGEYVLSLYKDLSASPFWTQTVSIPITPSLLTSEATMLTSDADYPTGAASSTYSTHRPNFRCKSVQIGIESVNAAASPVLAHTVSLDGTITGRY